MLLYMERSSLASEACKVSGFIAPPSAPLGGGAAGAVGDGRRHKHRRARGIALVTAICLWAAEETWPAAWLHCHEHVRENVHEFHIGQIMAGDAEDRNSEAHGPNVPNVPKPCRSRAEAVPKLCRLPFRIGGSQDPKLLFTLKASSHRPDEKPKQRSRPGVEVFVLVCLVMLGPRFLA